MSKKSYLEQTQRLNQDVIKSTKYMNRILMKGVKITAVGIGLIGLAKYSYSKEDNTITQTEVNKPITIEEVEERYLTENPEVIKIDNVLRDYNTAYQLEDVKELNEKYSKYIETTAEISSIKVGSLDGDYVLLEGYKNNYDDYIKMQCFLEKDELVELKDYKVGEDITIQGYCKGGKGMTVRVVECEIK